jgi:protein-histidine pros-kinase
MASPSALAEARRSRGWHFSAHLYLAVGMALVIGMLVTSYMQASAGLEAMKQFGLSSQQANHLDRLALQLFEAQSATRGYALTRDPAHLSAFRASVAKTEDLLQTIEDANGSRDDGRTGELVHHARAQIARMTAVSEAIERGVRPEKSWFEQGTRAMDAYKRQHYMMKAELLTRNLQNVKDSVAGFENARISTVLLAIASLTLLVLAVSQKIGKQELQDKIQDLLEAENERLEREVRNRTQELTNLATYLTEVPEAEKQRLARELHDELGALLTAAKLDADWIERSLPPESRALIAQRLARLRQSLTSGITLKRRITNDLRPALLYELGLVDALRALIEEFRQSEDVEVSADLPETEPQLSEAVSLSCFRIVQEAFTNIRKYAAAKHVRVTLHASAKAIELSIEDDGVGFDPESPKLARHGLAGIKHRVMTHGGRLDIVSAPGAGVKVHAVLPLEAA